MQIVLPDILDEVDRHIVGLPQTTLAAQPTPALILLNESYVDTSEPQGSDCVLTHKIAIKAGGQ